MRGKPDGFGEKTGKFDTYTFGGRRKLRGENFEPRKTSHCSARNTHTKTGCEKAVCTNTNTVRLPLSDLEKETKSLIESLYHHEASKTHTPRKSREQKQLKLPWQCESCDHRSNRRDAVAFFDVLSSSS